MDEKSLHRTSSLAKSPLAHIFMHESTNSCFDHALFARHHKSQAILSSLNLIVEADATKKRSRGTVRDIQLSTGCSAITACLAFDG